MCIFHVVLLCAIDVVESADYVAKAQNWVEYHRNFYFFDIEMKIKLHKSECILDHISHVIALLRVVL